MLPKHESSDPDQISLKEGLFFFLEDIGQSFLIPMDHSCFRTGGMNWHENIWNIIILGNI